MNFRFGKHNIYNKNIKNKLLSLAATLVHMKAIFKIVIRNLQK